MARKSSKQQRPVLIGYARVSTPEQSLEMQIAALERYGVPRNVIHVEKVSGAASRRPILDGILKTLRPEDRLVMWRLDRMGRSASDILQKLEHIEKLGAKFVSVTENIDNKTMQGRMMLMMAIMLAQAERDIIRERTQAGVKAAMERGTVFGQPPKLKPKQLVKAQRLRDKGLSLARVAEAMGVSPGTIRNWTFGPSDKRRGRKKRPLR